MSYTKIMTGMSGFTWTTTGNFGAGVSFGSDMNGDGHPDAVIGSQVMCGRGTGEGRGREKKREGERRDGEREGER
jgi:hypothetical protein